MTLRVVQKGTGEQRHLVVLLLVDPSLDEAIRKALGPRPIIVADVQAPVGVGIESVLRFGAMGAGALIDGYTLGGWSLGCSRVREMLLAGAKPKAVVCADGTTVEYPVPRADHLGAWQRLADAARDGEVVFAASHTYLVYTEQLRAPHVPYTSTVGLLRRVTGLDLPEPDVGAPPAETHDGDLHIYSCQSGDCDAAAHIHQAHVLLPMMLARHVRPIVEGSAADVPPPDASVTTRPATWRLKQGDRGPAVVALQKALVAAGVADLVLDGAFGPRTRAAVLQAQRNAGLEPTGIANEALIDALGAPSTRPEGPDLASATLREAEADVGIHETAANDGPDIRRLYLTPLGLPPGSEWCAPAVCSWLRRASAKTGRPSPVKGSPAAKALMAQFQAIGAFVPRSKLTEADIVPGVIVFWDRATPGRPETSWHGHTGIVRAACTGGTFGTVEANSGASSNEVAHMVRTFNDPRLLGVGKLRS